MKKTLTLGLMAILGLSFAMAKPARAGTPPNAAIQGTWAFGSSANGQAYNVAAGTVTFNGNGGVTGVMSYNDSGEDCIGAGLSGTYVVNPGKLSGTATMTVSSVNTNNCGYLADGDTLTLAFYLGANLKIFNYTEIDQGVSGFFINDYGFPLGGAGTHF
jgi:hypothetical protein